MKKIVDHTQYLGKWTLILGDVNTGKTLFSRAILEDMCRHELAERIAIIDLAPEIPSDVLLKRGLKGIGGRLPPPPEEDVIYLSAQLTAPRVSSANEAEAIEKAKLNAPKIEALFKQYQQLKRDILFINDISLALQVEGAEKLIESLRVAKCIVANGYYGIKLASGELSGWERRQMDLLKKSFHQIIST